MALIDIILAGLCLNATCPQDDDNRVLTFRQQRNNEILLQEIQNENFIVTTIRNEGLSGFNVVNGTTIGTGVAFDILNILQKKYKFNYTVLVPPSNTWGSDENGILQMLKQKKANLSAAFLPYITQYAEDITYSSNLDTGDWVVMMRRPSESATGSGLLAPFTLPVWILILISVTIVGPIIHFIVYIQVRLCKEANDKVFPLSSCCWFVYGALLKQGSTLNPTTDSSRLLFATWWIFITILTAFYTANLTAFLTLSKFTLPINEPKNIGSKRYKWVTTKGNALEDSLTLQDESARTLRRILGPPRYYIDNTDSYILDEYVNKQDMMFIREKPIVENVMYEHYKKKVRDGIEEAKRCTFVFTDFTVTSYGRSFVYVKDFKYRSLFDNTIQYLVQSGIIKFKLTEDLPGSRICPMNLGSKERQLRNTDLLMTYMIIGGGFLISVVVFCLELLIRQYCSKYKEKPRTNALTKTTKPKNNNIGKNFNFFKEIDHGTFVTPPPPYHSLYQPPFIEMGNFKRKNINGRDYWVSNSNGTATLVPVRTPSALLFQYTN